MFHVLHVGAYCIRPYMQPEMLPKVRAGATSPYFQHVVRTDEEYLRKALRMGKRELSPYMQPEMVPKVRAGATSPYLRKQ